jgi:GNAT superfamily N-acetyltransferase
MSDRMLPDGYSDVAPGKLACVVTSLQMTAKPPGPRAAGRDGATIRRVHAPDAAWYRGLYRRVGEAWLWSSRLLLSDDALLGIIRDPGVEIHALAIEGVDEGLLELDFRSEGGCELAFFGLSPGRTGQGLGPWLMATAIERAWARPIERFWVHTCTLDHPGALRFYMRSGFVPFRAQVEIMDDPRSSGVLSPDAAPFVPRL